MIVKCDNLDCKFCSDEMCTAPEIKIRMNDAGVSVPECNTESQKPLSREEKKKRYPGFYLGRIAED